MTGVTRREPPRNGDEQDVVAAGGRWRRMYCYTQRAGVTAKIKRQIRRRERRAGREEARGGSEM